MPGGDDVGHDQILADRRKPVSSVAPPGQLAMGQILFVQGGGEGTHDAWDDKLVASLTTALGAGHEVRYPRMPDEQDPSSTTWVPAIQRELGSLADNAVVVGHSVGGTLLVQALTTGTRLPTLAGIVLISAPFVGPGGWPGEAFELASDLGARLPSGAPVEVFHGLDDQVVPPSHARLYGDAIPQARLHLLPGRDHQLDDDLREVAAVIDASRRNAPSLGRGG